MRDKIKLYGANCKSPGEPCFERLTGRRVQRARTRIPFSVCVSRAMDAHGRQPPKHGRWDFCNWFYGKAIIFIFTCQLLGISHASDVLETPTYLCQGSPVDVKASDLDMDVFDHAPKAWVFHRQPVTGDLVQTKLRLLSRPTAKNPLETVRFVLDKGIEFYDLKSYFPKDQAISQNALFHYGELESLEAMVVVETEEGVVELSMPFVLSAPFIRGVSESNDTGKRLVTVIGDYFGQRAPVLMMEFAKTKKDGAISYSYKKCSNMRALTYNYADASGREQQSCSILEGVYVGLSTATYKLPKENPKGFTGNFVLRNAAGYAVVKCQLDGSIDVDTADGPVRGMSRDESEVFLGIPFAAPPIDENRWREPQPVASWTERKECFFYSPACPQYNILSIGNVPMSEDCLYLNVFKPSGTVDEKLPVMFWSYGGQYRRGAASAPYYWGGNLANEQKVIVVVANYRVDVFGFLVTEELYAESPHGAGGNYGLLDQIAALEWVKNNIVNFGGDPDNVTFFGMSAGASTTSAMITSPLTEGLIHRGIIQSGSIISDIYLTNNGQGGSWRASLAEGEFFKSLLECETLEEMRALPAETLLEAAYYINPIPVMDGYVITDTPRNLFVENTRNIPLILGVNKDDDLVIYEDMDSIDVETYETWVTVNFGDNAAAVLARYPATNDYEAIQQFRAVQKYAIFQEPERYIARKWAGKGYPTYFYRFNRVPATEDAYLGCIHSTEVPYIFDIWSRTGYNAEDYALGVKMRTYWANFARNGNPNGENLVEWPVYSVDTEENIELDTTIRVNSKIDETDLDFFEAVAPRLTKDFP